MVLIGYKSSFIWFYMLTTAINIKSFKRLQGLENVSRAQTSIYHKKTFFPNISARLQL